VERGPFNDGMHDGMELLLLWNSELELVDIVCSLQHRSVMQLLYLFEIVVVLIMQYITPNCYQLFEREQELQCHFEQFNAMEKKSSELVTKVPSLEQQQRMSAKKYTASLELYYLESIKLIWLNFAFCFAIVFLEVSSELCDSMAELRRKT
jgi:hypothetical protein